MKRTFFLITIRFCLISYGHAEKLKVTSYLLSGDSVSITPYSILKTPSGDFITKRVINTYQGD